mmetsp:Transcript_11646/g.25200  ORF Transcript_11646/g.25200 Transcript_11646/m.25200 type:complete len:376 (+) Transcript_11646:266-1393(+)
MSSRSGISSCSHHSREGIHLAATSNIKDSQIGEFFTERRGRGVVHARTERHCEAIQRGFQSGQREDQTRSRYVRREANAQAPQVSPGRVHQFLHSHVRPPEAGGIDFCQPPSLGRGVAPHQRHHVVGVDVEASPHVQRAQFGQLRQRRDALPRELPTVLHAEPSQPGERSGADDVGQYGVRQAVHAGHVQGAEAAAHVGPLHRAEGADRPGSKVVQRHRSERQGLVGRPYPLLAFLGPARLSSSLGGGGGLRPDRGRDPLAEEVHTHPGVPRPPGLDQRIDELLHALHRAVAIFDGQELHLIARIVFVLVRGAHQGRVILRFPRRIHRHDPGMGDVHVVRVGSSGTDVGSLGEVRFAKRSQQTRRRRRFLRGRRV